MILPVESVSAPCSRDARPGMSRERLARWRLPAIPRPTRRGLATALGALLLATSPGCGPDRDAPPHVVLFVIDTLRADALGAYGSTRTETPAFDALAERGILFENAYTPAPWTLPATVSLLTSTPPCEHGVVLDGDRVAPTTHTLAERMAEAGYETASFYANPYAGPTSGMDRGFDTASLRRFTDGETVAHWLTERSDPGRPFFLYVHNVEPHDPYGPAHGVHDSQRAHVNRLLRRFRSLTRVDWKKGESLGTTDNTEQQRRLMDRMVELESTLRALYRADVQRADRRLGSVVDALREHGVWEDTVLVVTSDHGEAFGEHGGWLHDQSLYEELVRVPLLVRLPRDEEGHQVDAPATLLDVAPTLLERVGAPTDSSLRGRTLAPVLRNGDALVPREGPLLIAQRINRKKFYRPFHEQRGELNVALRQGRWKGIWNPEPRRFELYDLAEDPREKENVADRHRTRAEAWQERAERRLQGCATETRGPAEAELDPESREQLRALGYID